VVEGVHVKCLSIREPWLTLILLGKKDYEYRTWQIEHRGDLALHASKTFGQSEREAVNHMKRMGILSERNVANMRKWLGHVRAVALLRDIFDFGFTENKEHRTYAWKVVPKYLLARPLIYKSKLGLFSVPDDLIAKSGVTRRRSG
jgi:hypothetical protein